jgi:hypothetical protein
MPGSRAALIIGFSGRMDTLESGGFLLERDGVAETLKTMKAMLSNRSTSTISAGAIPLRTGSNISTAILGDRSHGQMVNQYFNTSLFTVNAIGTYGNAPRNVLANPGLFNIDMAAIKYFPINEGRNSCAAPSSSTCSAT